MPNEIAVADQPKTNIFERMRQVRQSLPTLAPKIFNIRTKHEAIQPFTPSELQMRFWLDPDCGADIILKARQLGMSTMTVIEFLAYFLFVDGFNGVIISKEKEHSKYLLRMAHLAMDMLPEKYKLPLDHSQEGYLISKPPIYRNGRRVGGGRGSSLYIGTAGQASFGIGMTIHAAHCSELSRWPATEKGDAATILQGLEQAVPDVPGAILRIESTANGRGDTFHILWRKAEKNIGRYRGFFFPWWFAIDDEYRWELESNEELSFDDEETELIERVFEIYHFKLSPEHIKWRRRKIESFLPQRDKFFEEYPEDADTCFLQSGHAVFREYQYLLHDVSKRLEGKEPLMQRAMHGMAVKFWKMPKSGRSYAMAVDCAEAEKEKSNLHAGILGEIDGKGTCEEAVTFEGKASVPDLAMLCETLGDQYSALIAVERTSKGYALLDRLLEAFNEGDHDFELYSHQEFDQEAGEHKRILGFRPTRAAQDAAIGRWGEDFASGEYIAHDSETISQALDYIHDPRTGKPTAPRGGFDDYLDCAFILNYVKDEVTPERGKFDVEDWGS